MTTTCKSFRKVFLLAIMLVGGVNAARAGWGWNKVVYQTSSSGVEYALIKHYYQFEGNTGVNNPIYYYTNAYISSISGVTSETLVIPKSYDSTAEVNGYMSSESLSNDNIKELILETSLFSTFQLYYTLDCDVYSSTAPSGLFGAPAHQGFLTEWNLPNLEKVYLDGEFLYKLGSLSKFEKLKDIYFTSRSDIQDLTITNVSDAENVTAHVYYKFYSDDMKNDAPWNKFKDVVPYKADGTISVRNNSSSNVVLYQGAGTGGQQLMTILNGTKAYSGNKGDSYTIFLSYDNTLKSATLKRNGENLTLASTTGGAYYVERNLDGDVSFEASLTDLTCNFRIMQDICREIEYSYERDGNIVTGTILKTDVTLPCARNKVVTLKMPYDDMKQLNTVKDGSTNVTIPSPSNGYYTFTVTLPKSASKTWTVDWKEIASSDPVLEVMRTGDAEVSINARWDYDEQTDGYHYSKTVSCPHYSTSVTIPQPTHRSSDEFVWWGFDVNITPHDGWEFSYIRLGVLENDNNNKEITWYDSREKQVISRLIQQNDGTTTFTFDMTNLDVYYNFSLGNVAIQIVCERAYESVPDGNIQDFVRVGGKGAVNLDYEKEYTGYNPEIGEGFTRISIPDYNADDCTNADLYIAKVYGEKFTAYRDGVDVTADFEGESSPRYYYYNFDLHTRSASNWVLLFSDDEDVKLAYDWKLMKEDQVYCLLEMDYASGPQTNRVLQAYDTYSIAAENLQTVRLKVAPYNDIAPVVVKNGVNQTESLELKDGFYVLEYSASEMSDATWYISLQDSANFITFADEKVKEICLANWDTNQDGGLSYAEAAAVTSLGTVFKGNAEITSFDELRFFTGIKSIDSGGEFQNCTALQSLILPEGLETLGVYWGVPTFYNCTSLEHLVLPKSLTKLQNAIRRSGIRELVIPDGVTELKNTNIFTECDALKSLYISKGTTSISYDAFGYCKYLQSIVVDEDNEVYDSRDFCNGIVETATNTLIIGTAGTVIPKSVVAIGRSAFNNRQELTEIRIPATVTSIGYCAFANSSNLKSVVMESETPISFGEEAFVNISDQCVLTVPAGCKAAYIAKGWTTSVFKGGIVEAPSKFDVNEDGKVSIADVTKLVNKILGKE